MSVRVVLDLDFFFRGGYGDCSTEDTIKLPNLVRHYREAVGVVCKEVFRRHSSSNLKYNHVISINDYDGAEPFSYREMRETHKGLG